MTVATASNIVLGGGLPSYTTVGSPPPQHDVRSGSHGHLRRVGVGIDVAVAHRTGRKADLGVVGHSSDHFIHGSSDTRHATDAEGKNPHLELVGNFDEPS